LSLRLGGIKHFLKPLSEAGIDTTNLPYTYVSIPLKNVDKIISELKSRIETLTSMRIHILVVDSDKCFQPRRYRNIAFATRSVKIKGIIDLGAIAYFMGKKFKKYFIAYPTPVAYTGPWLGLKTLLRIAKIVDEIRGSGVGANIVEALRLLDVKSFDSMKWKDLMGLKHYPVAIVRVRRRITGTR